MKKNLLIAPLTLLLALVLGSCSGEKEKVTPDKKAVRPTNAKGARTLNGISYGFSSVPSNGRFNFPYNPACNCYKGQVTVYAYNGTGSEISSAMFVIGRVYTTSPIITYTAPADNTGNQREFMLESINSLTNGTASPLGSYAIRWYPADYAGEFWRYNMNSTITFTVKSTTYVGSEATWGVFPQYPYYNTTLVYGDDNVTFAKQY